MTIDFGTLIGITIGIRLVALSLLVAVFLMQAHQLNRPGLKGLRILLMALVAVIIAGDLFSISVNFFREIDGNLFASVRNTSLVWNAVSVLCTGVILYKIYTYKE